MTELNRLTDQERDFAGRMYPRGLRMAMKFGLGEDDAHGLVVEALFRCTGRALAAREPERYAFMAMANWIRDFLLRRKWERKRGLSGGGDARVRRLQARPRELGLLEFLALMPEPYATVAQLHFVEERHVKEVCQTLGEPYRRVRARLDVVERAVRKWVEMKDAE